MISAIVTAALSWAGILLFIHIMSARGKLEATNARSMHAQPLPVGAGIVVIPSVLVVWFLSQSSLSSPDAGLLVACAGLSLVSWLDDLGGLPPAPRLLSHALAVSWCIFQLGPELRAIPWLP